MKMYRNIPYEYNKWVAASGKIGKAYTCEHFDYAPYHVASFPTNTEEEMHERIDEYLDNKEKYEQLQKWRDASAAQYYEDRLRYQGD